MKKLLAILLAAVMAVGVLAGCSDTSDDPGSVSTSSSNSSSDATVGENTYAFMSKRSGSVFGEHMFFGFTTAINELDPEANVIDYSTTESGVTYQLTAMEELLTRKVKALCLATWAEAGFDEINQKYEAAGIPISSIDSRVTAQYRVTHYNQTDSEVLGRWYLWSSIIASQRTDITDEMLEGDGIEEAAMKIVNEHTGDPIIVGLISATPDSPVQLAWHASINAEIEKDVYTGKVIQDIKYGMDEQTEAANQLNAFLTEGTVDVVFCMSAFAETVCQSAATSDAQIPVVGLALCSNAYDVLPTEDEEAYDAVMPWAMLWDLQLQGFVAGTGIYYNLQGEFDGKTGSSFTTTAVDRFKEITYTAKDCPMDDGTEVICGLPLIFTKYNKDTWKDRV